MSVTFEWDESKAVSNERSTASVLKKQSPYFKIHFPSPLLMWSIVSEKIATLTWENPATGISSSWSTLNEMRRFASSVADGQRELNGEVMSDNKQRGPNQQTQDDDSIGDDIAPEYDFSRGERGKHAATTRDGYTMVIHRSDGVTE